MTKFVKRWFKDTEGATAVEFSMVGIPFILMIVGIIEMAMMFTAQSLLQESTFSAARLIRTGQLQQATGGGDPQDAFRTAVCSFAELLIPCADIQFQVQQVPSFADADDMPPLFDADGNMQNTGFDPGEENDVVLIRVVYNYPIITPLMQPVLTNTNGASRRMISTIVLQTEPYKTD